MINLFILVLLAQGGVTTDTEGNDVDPNTEGGGGSGWTPQTHEGDIGNPALGDTLQNFLNIGTRGPLFLTRLLSSLVTWGLIIGSLIFFFSFIIGAIQWMTSGGDKGKIEVAKSHLTNSLIGLVILFSVFAVIKLIENFFGTDILTLDISTLIVP